MPRPPSSSNTSVTNKARRAHTVRQLLTAQSKQPAVVVAARAEAEFAYLPAARVSEQLVDDGASAALHARRSSTKYAGGVEVMARGPGRGRPWRPRGTLTPDVVRFVATDAATFERLGGDPRLVQRGAVLRTLPSGRRVATTVPMVASTDVTPKVEHRLRLDVSGT